jgi:alkanesulfonate monooxygenase SsuD/methylene tetrahydromethanopterin reductase-like flavin-dependent oxidoreductase (luciferase family)
VAEAVGVTLPVEDGRPAENVALARLAERSGYDAVLAGEVARPEVFSLLGDETVHLRVALSLLFKPSACGFPSWAGLA